MAMGSTGGGEGLSSDINVTPLIDVLLVLLIIFMITQPMSRKAFDVQVPPEQRSQQKHQQSSQIVLELKPDGSYAINALRPARSPPPPWAAADRSRGRRVVPPARGAHPFPCRAWPRAVRDPGEDAGLARGRGRGRGWTRAAGGELLRSSRERRSRC